MVVGGWMKSDLKKVRGNRKKEEEEKKVRFDSLGKKKVREREGMWESFDVFCSWKFSVLGWW